MAKETFIMVSLDEDKSKELAKVISNETSRKILDFMGGEEDVSEADLAKKLKLPVSTVHYNVKHLLKAGLIESKEFKWSEKGKKVDLYNLARKLIVIAPKGTEGVKEKLKSFIPAILGAFAVSGALYVWHKFQGVPARIAGANEALSASRDMAMMKAAPEMAEAVPAVAQGVGGAVKDGVTGFAPTELNYALWFLIGSMFAIVISFLYSYWKMQK